MIALPILMQDFTVRHLTNSVLIGTMKFTIDQFSAFFTAQNPAPARLAAQQSEFQTAYDRLNAAYALTRTSLLTGDIANLDSEGDQLYLAVKETSEAAQRMTYVAARKQAGDRNMVFLKKYKINTKENFVSEWSKLQQLTEEANASTQITADMATLGLTEVMARLTDIAAQLREFLTQRNAELPSQKAMQQAREAIYPEYRALIDLLNAFAMVDENVNRYATLIQALNRNIDYVRVHAMTSGGATNGSSGTGSTDNGTASPDNNQGGATPDPSQGGGTGDNQGGGTGTIDVSGGGGTSPTPDSGGTVTPDPSQGGGNGGTNTGDSDNPENDGGD